MVSPAQYRPFSRARWAASADEAAVLDAGFKGVVGLAVVSMFASGLAAIDFPSLSAAPHVVPAEAEANSAQGPAFHALELAPISDPGAAGVTGFSALNAQAPFGTPPAAAPRTVTIGRHDNPLTLSPNALAVPLTNIAFNDDGLTLRLPARAGDVSRDRAFGPPTSGTGAQPSALRIAAENLVADWQAPMAKARDVALFVASDDETVSWSLSHASPNRGVLAYQGDHVEFSDLAVGLSMSVQDFEVAAAYVERSTPSQLFGARGLDEQYAGLVLTLHN